MPVYYFKGRECQFIKIKEGECQFIKLKKGSASLLNQSQRVPVYQMKVREC